MGQEIERKFLVTGKVYQSVSHLSYEIRQGYLSTSPQRSVRVRRKGNKAYLTIKGEANESGMSRFEWEKMIDVEEAEELFKICEPGMITKTRYVVKSGNHTFEVDEFHGENQGLVVAEIELSSEGEAFVQPDWIGQEVTGDPRYYNSMLMKRPFTTWE